MTVSSKALGLCNYFKNPRKNGGMERQRDRSYKKHYKLSQGIPRLIRYLQVGCKTPS